MKALSVKQPWANLIASGVKTIETRVWATDFRGDVLIASSKQPRIAPAGCAAAVVELTDCRPMTLSDEAAAMCPIYDDVVAWVLRNISAIKPFPVRGQLGPFEVDVSAEALRIAPLGTVQSPYEGRGTPGTEHPGTYASWSGLPRGSGGACRPGYPGPPEYWGARPTNGSHDHDR